MINQPGKSDVCYQPLSMSNNNIIQYQMHIVELHI